MPRAASGRRSKDRWCSSTSPASQTCPSDWLVGAASAPRSSLRSSAPSSVRCSTFPSARRRIAQVRRRCALAAIPGRRSPRQASGAAVEMRAALREATKIATSVGRVNLRMSVGVHSGTLHLFRVGRSHHELVIAGEGADLTAAHGADGRSRSSGGEQRHQVSTAGQCDSRDGRRRLAPEMAAASGRCWRARGSDGKSAARSSP